MTRVKGLVAAALLSFFATNGVYAQVPCQSKARGCFTFLIFGVDSDFTNPLLKAVAQGQKQPYEEDIAKKIHVQAENQVPGGARYSAVPLDIRVYVWRSSHIGLNRARIYDNPDGLLRRVRPAQPVVSERPPQTVLGHPDYVFTMTTSRKAAMITFPDEFFTPQTQVAFEVPGQRTVWPGTGRCIWFTDGTLPWYRSHTTWSRSFFELP